MNIGKVISAAVGFFLIAILFPIALSEVANATTTNWEASVVTIFQTVLPIIAVIGVAIAFLPEIKSSLGNWFKPKIAFALRFFRSLQKPKIKSNPILI